MARMARLPSKLCMSGSLGAIDITELFLRSSEGFEIAR
jgi:hypothetical protein